MDIRGKLRMKREEIIRIAKRHGAHDVRIFGSVARIEAGADSDIDLLVKTDSDTSPWFPAGLALDIGSLLESRVDVVTENALHWYVREKILKEALPL